MKLFAVFAYKFTGRPIPPDIPIHIRTSFVMDRSVKYVIYIVMQLSVVYQGGFGNQLFQIFATISFARKWNMNPIFPDKIHTAVSRKKTYWDSFLKNLSPFLSSSLFQKKIYQLPVLDFYRKVDIPPPPSEILTNCDLIVLLGYFQSYAYFHHDFDYIYTLLGIDDFKQELRTAYAPLFKTNTTVSLHFRIGDYDRTDVLGLGYYIAALSKLCGCGPHRILCFGEKENLYEIQEYVDALRRRFPAFEFILADFDCEDWQQVVLMSLCQHNIIANSTFSYFGAYFNMHADKRVFYPDTLKTECPESWTKIESLPPTTT